MYNGNCFHKLPIIGSSEQPKPIAERTRTSWTCVIFLSNSLQKQGGHLSDLTQNNPQQRGVPVFCPTLCQNSILGFLILGNFFYPERVSLAPLHLVHYSISTFSHVFCFSEKIYEFVGSWIKPYTYFSLRVSEINPSIHKQCSFLHPPSYPLTYHLLYIYLFFSLLITKYMTITPFENNVE